MNAEVSINRNLVALHPYGYTSFVVDLTPHLKYGAESEELFVNARHYAWQLSVMAVIRSTGQAAEIDLVARAEGLADAEIRLQAKHGRSA